MVKRTRPCLGALAVAAALACAAPAQGDAPQIDPDSPAGTEYQLPLDRAREEAGAGRGGATGGGTGGPSGGSAREVPLFGEGVEPSSSSPQPSQPRGGSASASDPATTATAELADAAPPETVRAQAPSPDGGGSELVAVGAGAGGVLLLGGLAGLLLRRRSMAD